MSKVINYTPEQVQTMRAQYQGANTDNERKIVCKSLANEFGKDIRSIRAKLVRENVYIAVTKVSGVTGEIAAKKDALAEKLNAVTGLNLVSMEKANKTDIQALINFAIAANLTFEAYEQVTDYTVDEVNAAAMEDEAEVVEEKIELDEEAEALATNAAEAEAEANEG